jgi:energy-coupling factor transport system permease protein
VLLMAIAAVAALVVAERRGQAPWARAYGLLVRLGLLTISISILLKIAFGARVPGHRLLWLPSVPLPDWLGGLSLGGPITGEAVLNAFVAGLRLAVLIACFGAANALAHPARLVRLLPAALYEVGVAVVVAMTFVPHLAESLHRVRGAQRLRGRPVTGLRGLQGLTVPVLGEALDRAISLAASMDSRGYGRRGGLPATARRASGALVLLGLGGAVAGTYWLISADSSRLGLALLIAGVALAVSGGLLGGRRVRRTRYRPDPWQWPEWLVTACGALVALVYQFGVHDSPAAGVALAWPALPVLPFLATVLCAVAAYATPAVPAVRTTTRLATT